MEELFATKIVINKLLNIEGFEIPLSETERKHLIITGKNGSGKTTLLRDLKEFFSLLIDIKANFDNRANTEIQGIKGNITGVSLKQDTLHLNYIAVNENTIDRQAGHFARKIYLEACIDFKNWDSTLDNYKSGNFILAFFEAKRNKILKAPTGINKVDMQQTYGIEDNAGQDFIQYIVNQKASKAFAKEANNLEKAEKIDAWFEDFEKNLFQLFDHDGAQLKFDDENFNFNIIEKDKPPYNLNQLSDGYAAIFDIVTELIMRMEQHKVKSYDVQGIVLIDEVETHLHLALQKKILPFLTAFFPRIQFIVTTHSPFVINSIKNAVVCDLEKREVMNDLSAYSYQAIVEGYFEIGEDSDEIKKEVAEFEILSEKESLSEEEKNRLVVLQQSMNKLQNLVSDALAVKIQQIRLKSLNRKEAA